MHMHINVDFNDVKTVMKDSGVAIMGSAVASGDKRALRAVENALVSPLLNDNDIRGARHVLLNIMSGSDDIEMDEFGEITDFIQEAAGGTAELITGYGTDASLGDNVSVTIIATGFNTRMHTGYEAPVFQERKIVNLDEPVVTQKPQIAQQTTILDEIQKAEEPYIYIKDASEEVKSESPVQEKQVEVTNTTVDFSITELSDTMEETSPAKEEESAKQEFVINTISSETTETVSEKSQEATTREEQIRLAQERIKKLKELTMKMKTPDGLAQLEKESAWARKNIQLDNNATPSKESQVSRYTLSEGDDKKIEIRPNNSFLHDNVD